MWRTFETKQKIVGANGLDVAVRGQSPVHGAEIDGAMVLVDLHGVAPAEGDVWASDAGQVGELARTADAAADPRPKGRNL
jgi:hypothetical protein